MKSNFVPRMATGFFVVWCIYAILSIVVGIGIVAVAIHFIAKFW